MSSVKPLCQCPEYFHESGRSHKKKITCKQCKGVKIPLKKIAGTMRVLSTPCVLNSAMTRNCFATVRLPSTSRPSILYGKYDPYDFLRQSRLGNVYTNCINENQNPPNNFLYPMDYRFPIKPSRHFESPYSITSSGRSINPYELISTTLHNNEFSPSVHLYNARLENNYPKDPAKEDDVDKCCNQRLDSTRLNCTQPPPPPAVESLPLSVKSAPNIVSCIKTSNRRREIGEIPAYVESNYERNSRPKLTESHRTANSPDSDTKRTIKQPSTIRAGNSSCGRLKRVQFNTLPDRKSMCILAEYNDKSPQKSSDKDFTLKKYNTKISRNPIIRSMSDRRDKETTEDVGFNDFGSRAMRPSCPPPKLPNQSVPQRPPRQQKKINRSESVSREDDFKAARIFGLLPVSTINKNKIKIESLTEPTSSSLNIENETSQIQKTSITINNECSSTVNVSEHHSSVIITDCSHQTTKSLVSTNANETLICLDGNGNFVTKNGPSHDHLYDLSSDFKSRILLKLLSDPHLDYLFHGIDMKRVAKLIETSLSRLPACKCKLNTEIEREESVLGRLHDIIKEERHRLESSDKSICISQLEPPRTHNSMAVSIRSSEDKTENESKNWTNGESKLSSSQSDHHQYELINSDPIYEEISEEPPPLPINPPPMKNEIAVKSYKPMFLGATKYDILSYLVDAKDRVIVPEESYTFKFLRRSSEFTVDTDHLEKEDEEINIPRAANMLINIPREGLRNINAFKPHADKCITSIERNDSGVGSETSESGRNNLRLGLKSENTKYLSDLQPNNIESSMIHLCEDCDGPIEVQMLEPIDVYMLITCQSCSKKRAERREILWEFVETEKKYTRDLQIVLDEFYQPMLVAGLLTQEQLSAIFLNIEELLENSISFSAKIMNAFDSANERGDDDLFTVDIGQIILEASPMLCAFETYCVQQAAASLLLANVEKEKELLRIFLRVSQMENTVLRRMNLNSFLMVPVQRVTKYPLLLSRLYKVTPLHVEGRERLKEAQERIECHLNRMNREAKDISTKLWRRLSSSPLRSRENEIINIKLRKLAIDSLDWNYDKVHFIIEGKLLITHPTDNSWRKGKTINVTPVNAILITNELATRESKHFPRYSPTKEAAFLLIREKSGRYSTFREPFYLDRCVVCTESDLVEYFEVHEISSKDSFIFKAEDDTRTKNWYTQLQYHAQGTGAWRKRRRALSNIMINGMMIRP